MRSLHSINESPGAISPFRQAQIKKIKQDSAPFNDYAKNYDMKKLVSEIQTRVKEVKGRSRKKITDLMQRFKLDEKIFFEEQEDGDEDSDNDAASHLKFDPVQVDFIQTLVDRLKIEQEQRLKTEEQSAHILEEMGKTMSRAEAEEKKSVTSDPVPFPQQVFMSPFGKEM